MGKVAIRPAAIRFAVFPLLLLSVGLTACKDQKGQTQKPAPPPSVVAVEATTASVPVVRQFIGTTAAVNEVGIRARVEGYLEQRPFTEGTAVKKGDVLFVIDQRPFQAALNEAKADLEQSKAALKFAQEQKTRYKKLAAENAASVQRYESAQSEELEAAGAVKSGEAAVQTAQLNLEYATITAPIDGRIGDALVHVGNLVSADSTLLTTLVQLDPIYVYFSPSDDDYQEIARYRAKGPLKVEMILAGDRIYKEPGQIDFVANRVDANTGTIKMRAVFPNPDEAQRPGQYVQVRLTLGEAPNSILVPASAVREDEAGRFVYIVGKDDKAERRGVELGPLYQGSYVVDDGVKAGERVVSEGTQKVRGGQTVTLTAGGGEKQ
jgi:RND family efflux transporter MFP subunit